MSTKYSIIERHCDVLIIGAGISGMLFYLCMQQFHSSLSILMMDASNNEEILKRGDKIPFYINAIPDIAELHWIPKNLKMEIWDNGKRFYYPTLEHQKNYSQKITRTNCRTTLSMLKPHKTIYIPEYGNYLGRQKVILEFINSKLDVNSCLYNTFLKKIDLEQKIAYSENYQIHYQYLVSTIPLSFFQNIILPRIIQPLPCLSYPFYMSVNSVPAQDIYHVIYCTDPQVRFNRAALLNDTLYIESNQSIDLSILNLKEAQFIREVTHLSNIGESNLSSFSKSPYVRFVNNDVNATNNLKQRLQQFQVYLLGRYATWQYILVENVWESSKFIVKSIWEDFIK